MARGEPLDNPTVLKNSRHLFAMMREKLNAAEPAAETNFKISSIIPARFEHELGEILADEDVDFYYSLYSLNPRFRKRWLPKAMAGEGGLDHCVRYQQVTGKRVVLHWAMIAGENDSDQDVDKILEAVQRRDLRCKFNLVRYNPHDSRHGVESPEDNLQRQFEKIQAVMRDPGSRIVPRVGFDVKASCGMFVGERPARKQPETPPTA
jgi:adenine C2-methylase RlmN of 23S rRNA A2503 and tRNA A37